MIGIPELMIIGIVGFPVVIALAGLVLFWVRFPRRAKQFGYPGTRAYLRGRPGAVGRRGGIE